RAYPGCADRRLRPAAFAPSARAGLAAAGRLPAAHAHARASCPGHAGDRRRRRAAGAAEFRPRLRTRAGLPCRALRPAGVPPAWRRDARRLRAAGRLQRLVATAVAALTPRRRRLTSTRRPLALQLVPQPGDRLQRPERIPAREAQIVGDMVDMAEQRRQRVDLLLDLLPVLPD